MNLTAIFPVLGFLAVIQIAFSLKSQNESNATNNVRSFRVDYDNDQFLMEGKSFRFVSGSLHYFRLPHEYWRDRLRKFRAAGLNAVATYVEWSHHNPEPGQYKWEGDADLEKFIQIAQEEDLYVILRPGPYVCAERDFGGQPYWLAAKYNSETKKIKPRTMDIDYLNEVRTWYSVLMPKMMPYLYGNGGPIIMVQVENEYGSYSCDHVYKNWLRDETLQYTQDKAALFTTDGYWYSYASCGKTDGVYATVDFGADTNVNQAWQSMRLVEPRGPFVNSEFYPGWLTHWGEENQRVKTNPVVSHLIQMLRTGASVNLYVFFGGTNFGFTSGANHDGKMYAPQLTSYDYDAPLTEAGDPTHKYYAIREAISQFLPLPDIPVPVVSPKGDYGSVTLRPAFSLLTVGNPLARQPVTDLGTLTFDQLMQNGGFVLYETILPMTQTAKLIVDGLHDRANVYVDGYFIGILNRTDGIYNITVTAEYGSKLQIFVENQGRINYGSITNEHKGINGPVVWGREVLVNWAMTGYPLDNIKNDGTYRSDSVTQRAGGILLWGPVLYQGVFVINSTDTSLLDTYLDTTGWGKGVAWVNGRPLGRYWPTMGPQVTLYVPGVYLKIGENILTILEQERSRDDLIIKFTKVPILDSVPINPHKPMFRN